MADFIPMFELRKQFHRWLDRSVRDSLRVKEYAQSVKSQTRPNKKHKHRKSNPKSQSMDRQRIARSGFKYIASSKCRDYHGNRATGTPVRGKTPNLIRHAVVF